MVWLVRFSVMIVTLTTAAASFWAWSQNPLATPMAERGIQEARLALTHAISSTVSPAWVEERLRLALTSKDVDGVTLYLELAAEHALTLPSDLVSEADVFLAAQSKMFANISDCATCAADIANCKKLAHIASCAIPIELSPVGDLNALRRAGVDWVNGDEIDRFDAGLAIVGLGATGLTIGTGGTSYSVKAGASLIRLARRLDVLTPPFTNSLQDITNIAIDWEKVPDYAVGRIPLADVTDTAKLSQLAAFATDMERVRDNTSVAEALSLMRHIESLDEAATLARVSDIQGAGTRKTIAILGKSRTFRTIHRLSDLTLLAIGLATALLIQVLAFLGAILRWIVRPTRHSLH